MYESQGILLHGLWDYTTSLAEHQDYVYMMTWNTAPPLLSSLLAATQKHGMANIDFNMYFSRSETGNQWRLMSAGLANWCTVAQRDWV